jgi:hypothetical protein
MVRMISNELYEGTPPALFAARQSFAIYAGCETGNQAFEVLINAVVFMNATANSTRV